MLQPHQRAALIPNETGVSWTQFLGERFVHLGSSSAFAIVVQSIAQKSPGHADLKGLVELSSGPSLPVVFPFEGALNLETRECSLHQTNPEKLWDGEISENGRVMILRDPGQAKLMHLVHEPTLVQLV